jgi:LPS sulfotransferase NodH
MRDPHETFDRLASFRADPGEEQWLLSLNRRLASAPTPPARADLDVSRMPLIYIVGAPRSGTTLLSQLVSKYLEVGYIDNLIARFWLAPAVGIRLSRLVLGAEARRSIALRSTHGATHDPAGPHEFGYYWRHWLKLDDASTHHLTPEELSRVDLAGLRHSLEREVIGAFGLPVVFKNVICGFQAGYLSDLHPASLFVHITRDPVHTACSILETRQARYGSYGAWWSLKPAAFESLRRPESPPEEVVLQVLHCRREFAAELAGVRSLTIEYEALCSEPDAELQRVCDAISAIGTRMRPLAPVEPLRPSSQRTIDHETRAAVVRALDAHREYIA